MSDASRFAGFTCYLAYGLSLLLRSATMCEGLAYVVIDDWLIYSLMIESLLCVAK